MWENKKYERVALSAIIRGKSKHFHIRGRLYGISDKQSERRKLLKMDLDNIEYLCTDWGRSWI